MKLINIAAAGITVCMVLAIYAALSIYKEQKDMEIKLKCYQEAKQVWCFK